jgi:hypothetical protein
VDLVITGGAEKYCDPRNPLRLCHSPNSEHYNGNAVDFGFGANRGIERMRGRFFCCAAKCGFQFGQTEGGRGPHYHIQTVPGRLGGRGEIPKDTKDCC